MEPSQPITQPHSPYGNVPKSCTGWSATQTIRPVTAPTPCCYMAEAGLHSFDYDSGRWVNAELEKAGLDEDAKHTVIMKLHPHPSVGKLLLQRCGMSSRWLTGNRARLMSRRLRDYQFSPAFIRNLLEHIGVDPNTYYIIGPDYRIPEPSEEEKAQCIQSLQQVGFTTQNIQSALATLGVPPGGHHPPKRSSKKQA